MPDRFEWLKKQILPNWNLKLSAVLLAALTYYAIRGATGFEVTYEVPLEIKVQKGIAILDQDARQVEVTFRGTQDDVRQLDQRLIKAVIDVRGKEASGSREIAIHPRDIEGHSGTTVVKIHPSVATVFLDHEAEKEVPVAKPKTIGKPLVGKAEVDYEPKSVVIRGPERRLTEQYVVLTEPVDVDGRVESFTKRVHVLPPSDTWLSSIDPSEINVRVTIIAESASSEFPDVPVLAAMPSGETRSVHLSPDKIRVVLHGRPEVLETITAESVKAFVEVGGLDKSASYELPVRVHVPAGADVAPTAIPSTVKVSFSAN